MPHNLTLAQGVFSGLAVIVGSAYANFWKTGQGFSLFKVVFYTSDQPMLIVGLDGKPIHVNPAAERLFGYSEKEFRKMAFPEFTHREDIATDVELFEELKSGIRESYLFRKRWFSKMDTLIWGLLSVTSIRDNEGELIAVLSTINVTPTGPDAQLERIVRKVTESAKKRTGVDSVFSGAKIVDKLKKPWTVAGVVTILLLAFYATLGGGLDAIIEIWREIVTNKPETP